MVEGVQTLFVACIKVGFLGHVILRDTYITSQPYYDPYRLW